MTPTVGKYLRFMPVALAYATMSKDRSTKVGALVLGPGYEVRSSGWNGAPRGCNADEDERFDVRSEKLLWVSHSEANAITNAARCGVSLDGCTMLVTMPPCMSCAKLIVQAGITRVISSRATERFAERWKEDLDRSSRLFAECGVEYIETDII
jgi:dCMP deaminase